MAPPSLPPVVPHPSSRLNAVPAARVRAWRGGGGGRQQRRASPESHAGHTHGLLVRGCPYKDVHWCTCMVCVGSCGWIGSWRIGLMRLVGFLVSRGRSLFGGLWGWLLLVWIRWRRLGLMRWLRSGVGCRIRRLDRLSRRTRMRCGGRLRSSGRIFGSLLGMTRVRCLGPLRSTLGRSRSLSRSRRGSDGR
jgi:hypothetical protein